MARDGRYAVGGAGGAIATALAAGLAVACGTAAGGPAGGAGDDRGALVRLPGHVPVWTGRAADLGPIAPDQPVADVTALLARSPAQERAWQAFLAAQQTPGSPDYRAWLTPEQIADRFGPSQADAEAVASWLASRGLHVDAVARSRAWITFDGTAATVASALSTTLHRFTLAGAPRVAPALDPAVPSSLAATVRAFAGLSSSAPRPMGHGRPGGAGPRGPDYDYGSDHYVAPADFETIYDLGSVYAQGLDGKGETIAIAGRSRVTSSDITEFQQETGEPVVAPTVVVPTAGVDPGATGDGDQLEATIDVTRAGSVAPGATIELVVSGTPSGSMLDGLAIAIEYAVDDDVAPVLSISFGECEQTAGMASTELYDTLFQQAAGQGMSVLVSAGDAGAAGCDQDDTTPPATQVASANYICASGSATCVGGTEFADTASPSTYWGASNSSTLGSALSYIPEGAWNEPLNAQNEPQVWAGGGGVSIYVTKPSWQKGTGVPADGFRDTPDVAFSASEHDGYYACYAIGDGDCSKGQWEYFWGTSAAAPSMAAIVAIADQRTGTKLGNVNPTLYSLAAGASAAQIFHDVTVATSAVASCTSVPSMCNNSTAGPTGLTGGLAGYPVGAGYDQATGWGSMDVASFLTSFGCLGEADGTACDDGDACTKVDACQAGVCTGTMPVTCTAMDTCHTAGTCDPMTGACSSPAKPDGATCDDGDACDTNDACTSGVCAGTAKACAPSDACHTAGTCDAKTGACSNPMASNGTACDGGACMAGACEPVMTGGGDGGAGAGDGGIGAGDAGGSGGGDASGTPQEGAADGGGSGGGGGSSSGCGCRVAGDEGAGGGASAACALALAVVFAGRRRRARKA